MNQPTERATRTDTATEAWLRARRWVLRLIVASCLTYAVALISMPSSYSLTEGNGSGCNDLIVESILPRVLSYGAYALLLAALAVWVARVPTQRRARQWVVAALTVPFLVGCALITHGAQGFLTAMLIVLVYSAIVWIPLLLAILALSFSSLAPQGRRPLFGILALAFLYPFLTAPFAPHVVWSC